MLNKKLNKENKSYLFTKIHKMLFVYKSKDKLKGIIILELGSSTQINKK